MRPSMSMRVPSSEEEGSQRDAETRWLGTVLGLAAWTMFFVSLSFAVGWYRMREPWPPLPISTVLLALPGLPLVFSSAMLHRAARVQPVSPREARRLLRLLGMTLASGAVFVAMQAAWTHLAFWNHHFRIPDDGVPASAFYGLTALHALHVLVVLAGVFFSTVRLKRSAEVGDSLRRLSLGGYFVTAMWLLLFVAVYLP
ncbi:cytochrome c oxidase subunit 3 [Pyxidicoccus parkwayensis]|uniref:Cytochrome c oxidase subunit 3 n=1 Tax=Pyxidicoccus parkwayensis TaxID=2813578 RepID=A0ABX7NS55_9BACT|nr:cytochrome c oxidase subunit 3 [Pyxidicoccus parkwaysis]QSQ21605.1 cytochrome c oxidase subunit 3 [Pyxidicoccus parkwaysis]